MMGRVLSGLILVGILALALWAIVAMRRDRKQGRSCTGCSGCPMAGNCDKQKEKNDHDE